MEKVISFWDEIRLQGNKQSSGEGELICRSRKIIQSGIRKLAIIQCTI
jgi:hypothetical protein